MWLVTLCYSSILSCGYFCILSPGYSMFFVFLYCDHRDIHVLTASFPTRRSSDLPVTSLNAPRFPGGFGWLMPELFRAFDIICFCKHQRHGGIEACRARRWTVIRRCGEPARQQRSEEHTSELQSLMRISYAVFCLNKKKKKNTNNNYNPPLNTPKDRRRN